MAWVFHLSHQVQLLEKKHLPCIQPHVPVLLVRVHPLSCLVGQKWEPLME